MGASQSSLRMLSKASGCALRKVNRLLISRLGLSLLFDKNLAGAEFQLQ